MRVPDTRSRSVYPGHRDRPRGQTDGGRQQQGQLLHLGAERTLRQTDAQETSASAPEICVAVQV